MIKIICAVLSIAASLGMTVPYLANMLKGTAKPHIFSWTTWAILTGIGFVLSITHDGGYGAWLFAFQSLSCLIVVGYALFKGDKNITALDWISFICAIVISVFYFFTENAQVSVVLAAAVDALGFVPTFRKSYMRPYDEPVLAYVLFFASFLFSLGALNSYTLVTVFYPAVLAACGFILAVFLLARRRAISVQPNPPKS